MHKLAGQSVNHKHKYPKGFKNLPFRVQAREELKRLHHAVQIEKVRKYWYEYTSPRMSSWVCIHSGEGAWNSNTGNGYYGGLQMNWDFMRAYGPEFLKKWGTADKWPYTKQIQAADRAWKIRGYDPWPQTARKCGLI